MNIPQETHCGQMAEFKPAQELVSTKALNTTSSYLKLSQLFANGTQF